MLCGPTARVAVEKVAVPAASVPVPSVVAPSLKVTEPVAVEGDIVAVNVTLVPSVGDALVPDSEILVEMSAHAAEDVDPVGLVPKLQAVGADAPAGQ